MTSRAARAGGLADSRNKDTYPHGTAVLISSILTRHVFTTFHSILTTPQSISHFSTMAVVPFVLPANYPLVGAGVSGILLLNVSCDLGEERT